MTEKRFTTNIHRIYDDKEQIACADTMDYAEILVDLLNEQEERIKKLKETIIKITHSYHQKHDNTIVNLVDEVYGENIGKKVLMKDILIHH